MLAQVIDVPMGAVADTNMVCNSGGNTARSEGAAAIEIVAGFSIQLTEAADGYPKRTCCPHIQDVGAGLVIHASRNASCPRAP